MWLGGCSLLSLLLLLELWRGGTPALCPIGSCVTDTCALLCLHAGVAGGHG